MGKQITETYLTNKAEERGLLFLLLFFLYGIIIWNLGAVYSIRMPVVILLSCQFSHKNNMNAHKFSVSGLIILAEHLKEYMNALNYIFGNKLSTQH